MIKMRFKYLFWFLGLLVISAGLLFVLLYPVASLLRWQSPVLWRCFLILAFCFALCMFRLIRGPSTADRAAALHILGILIVGFCAVLSISTGRDWYIDIAVAWALQSFIGTLALAKYLEAREFDE